MDDHSRWEPPHPRRPDAGPRPVFNVSLGQPSADVAAEVAAALALNPAPTPTPTLTLTLTPTLHLHLTRTFTRTLTLSLTLNPSPSPNPNANLFPVAPHLDLELTRLGLIHRHVLVPG